MAETKTSFEGHDVVFHDVEDEIGALNLLSVFLEYVLAARRDAALEFIDSDSEFDDYSMWYDETECVIHIRCLCHKPPRHYKLATTYDLFGA